MSIKDDDGSDNLISAQIAPPSRNLQVIGDTIPMERLIGYKRYKNDPINPIKLPTKLFFQLRTYSNINLIFCTCNLCKEKFYKTATFLDHIHSYHGMID